MILRRQKRRAAGRVVPTVLPARRAVGTCGSCGGPLLYAPELAEAICPCGQTRLPAAFVRMGLREP